MVLFNSLPVVSFGGDRNRELYPIDEKQSHFVSLSFRNETCFTCYYNFSEKFFSSIICSSVLLLLNLWSGHSAEVFAKVFLPLF